MQRKDKKVGGKYRKTTLTVQVKDVPDWVSEWKTYMEELDRRMDQV